jgi:serine/threonine protein kinase
MSSLGATWFHVVCGRPPFLGETNSATMKLHCTKPPLPPGDLVDDLPKPVANLILKMLSKKQGDRVPSMEALLSDLKMILKGKGAIGGEEKKVDTSKLGALRTSRAAAPARTKPKIPAEVLLVGVLLAIAAVFVVLMILK